MQPIKKCSSECSPALGQPVLYRKLVVFAGSGFDWPDPKSIVKMGKPTLPCQSCSDDKRGTHNNIITK